MATRITIYALAQRLGVHPMTVSRALRNSPKISVVTRQRVQSLAQRLHYTPNYMARCLSQRSSRTLGVIFPYATTPYYATLLDALYTHALDRGFQIEIRFHRWNEVEEAAAFRSLLERQVDGLILLAAAIRSFKVLRDLLPAGGNLPVATMGTYSSRDLPPFVRGCVVTDMRQGSTELGEFLLKMDHHEIALLCPQLPPPSDVPDITDRIHWLRVAIERQPEGRFHLVTLDDVPDAFTGADWEFRCVHRMAEKFLQLDPRPTAVVTNNEPQAHVLLEILQARGCRVPEDVSVACYDGTFLSEYGTVPLTCVRHQFPELARHLVDLVVTKPANGQEPPPELRVVAPALARRRSVARLRNGATLSERQKVECSMQNVVT